MARTLGGEAEVLSGSDVLRSDSSTAAAAIPEQNAADREACRRLVAEGFGSDEVYLTWL